MGIFSDIGRSLKHGFEKKGKNALRNSFATAANFFRGSSKNGDRDLFCKLIRYLCADEKGFFPGAEKSFIRVMEHALPDIEPYQVWHHVESAPPAGEKEISAGLAAIAPGKRGHFIRLAAGMIGEKNSFPGAEEKLEKCALDGGMEEEEFRTIVTEIKESMQRRERLLRSGAGIAAALIVIAVFILTATLLRSVIFGLIAAYLLLPLEQYLERNLREKRGIGFYLGKLSGALWYLPRRLASALKRKDQDNPPTEEMLQKKAEQLIISRAVGQTIFVLLLAIVLFAGGIYSLSVHYLRGVRENLCSVPVAVQNQPNAPKSAGSRFLTPQLRQIREKLNGVPVLKYLMDRVQMTLRDEQTRQELTSMLWRRSGGVFSFLFNVMGFVGTLLCDLLLTLFFGLLFLMKMAEFKSAGRGSGENYAVQTILVSRWLPNVSESTLAEAQRILSGVFSRLRIWVRGYLTLVLIDSTVYTILFGLLDVPYFPVLGIIAGCGILLPYVGPILSCALTLLVTYLAGDAGAAQLLLVLCSYLIYNGIIEQFILYPMVIGESLGLTTLETIIVVLLGAIFAGIAGMILALPAASVIKYLVPRIYGCWDLLIDRKTDDREQQGYESAR